MRLDRFVRAGWIVAAAVLVAIVLFSSQAQQGTSTASVSMSFLRVSPVSQTVSLGTDAEVNVVIETSEEVAAFEFELLFSRDVLEVETIVPGPFLSSTGRQVFCIDVPGESVVRFSCVSYGQLPTPPSGSGAVAILAFSTVGPGTSRLNLQGCELATVFGVPLPVTCEDGSITVVVGPAFTPTATATPAVPPTATGTPAVGPTATPTRKPAPQPTKTPPPTAVAATATPGPPSTATATAVAPIVSIPTTPIAGVIPAVRTPVADLPPAGHGGAPGQPEWLVPSLLCLSAGLLLANALAVVARHRRLAVLPGVAGTSSRPAKAQEQPVPDKQESRKQSMHELAQRCDELTQALNKYCHDFLALERKSTERLSSKDPPLPN